MFPGLKVDDVFTLDGEEMRVISHIPPHYWIQNNDTSSYYYMCLRSEKELGEAFAAGRMTLGKPTKEKGGSAGHWHTWKRYTGLNKVVDLCSCGTEREIDWHELGDGKSKDKKGV